MSKMINNEFGFNDTISELMVGKSLGDTNGILAAFIIGSSLECIAQ